MSISTNRIRPASAAHARIRATAAVLWTTLIASGCALTPAGLPDEQARLAGAGASYEPQAEQRVLPMPRNGDDWGALVQRALLANGELEAAYFRWKAAVEKVPGASAWPNSNLTLSYDTMFSGNGSLGAGFDAMENLAFPTKTQKAGEIALAEARAAAQRFRAKKFEVQKRVLDAWLDLALAAERERIRMQRRELAGLGNIGATAAISAGESERAALQGGLDEIRSRDAMANAGADLSAARAMVAAMAALTPATQIALPTRLPEPRQVPQDVVLLSTAASGNPELAELAAMLRARDGEFDLARMQWIPDINPTFSLEELATETLGAMIVLPTAIVEIRSAIAQAASLRSATAAELGQTERDRNGAFLAALVALRNAERERALIEEQILPMASTVVAAARAAYVSGKLTLSEFVESHQVILEAREELARAAVEREKRVAELEELAGLDMETMEASAVALVASVGAATAAPGAEVVR